MAEASNAEAGGECAERGPEGPSPESVPPGTAVSRVKLLDTTVDTFLQKLVAAASFQRFTDCYQRFYQLQPEMTRRLYDKFITQLQTSVREEVAEIKAEGNLEAVLSTLDAIVEEGKAREEPACSGTPCSAGCRGRRWRTSSWRTPCGPDAGMWRRCSCRAGPSGRSGRWVPRPGDDCPVLPRVPASQLAPLPLCSLGPTCPARYLRLMQQSGSWSLRTPQTPSVPHACPFRGAEVAWGRVGE
ncbi:polyamine-modulated factor 1 [Pteropus vampyrus]|uniref:Polyamine-modulated factor 1 n=1 Tax=Pteropus vampyrus TaxID=132908 RepID=A0A6P6CRQ7_PTEVA|nr:polyamine-modulated factor 1 [Pteropus vampyrus]